MFLQGLFFKFSDFRIIKVHIYNTFDDKFLK